MFKFSKKDMYPVFITGHVAKGYVNLHNYVSKICGTSNIVNHYDLYGYDIKKTIVFSPFRFKVLNLQVTSLPKKP